MGNSRMGRLALAVVISVCAHPPRTSADESGNQPQVARRHAAGYLPSAIGSAKFRRTDFVPSRRLPGEFEPQRAILISCHELIQEWPTLFARLVSALRDVPVVAMVNDSEEQKLAVKVLREHGVPRIHVQFTRVKHDTMWARDYGPVIVTGAEGRLAVVDARYAQDRGNDDNVPIDFARQHKLPLIPSLLGMDGGNLISNGVGLCLATRRLLNENLADGFDEQTIRDVLGETYGATNMVFLEPLRGEPTGHVDMFVTFPSNNTVVVASIDPATDAVNSAILNRNADLLSQIHVKGRLLRVVRVPMPSHSDNVWRSYTNVVYANGTIVVPSYQGEFRTQDREAGMIFAGLLPGWKVVRVDASELATLGGALHCITMNLGPLDPRHAAPKQTGRVTAATGSSPAESSRQHPPGIPPESSSPLSIRTHPAVVSTAANSNENKRLNRAR